MVSVVDSALREIAYTARKVDSDEALSIGMVSKVLEDKDKMVEEAVKVAELIASKSPVAVQGTKRALVYARDHPVQTGLDQVVSWKTYSGKRIITNFNNFML